MVKVNFILVLSIFFVACDDRREINKEDKSIIANSKKSYSTRGYVLELIPEDDSAFIHHEMIPGFMEEMTMYLKLENPSEFNELKPGHEYSFDMIVDREDGTYIRNVTPTGKSKSDLSLVNKPSEKWFKKPTFELGDKLPDFSLMSSDGKVIDQSKLTVEHGRLHSFLRDVLCQTIVQ